MSIVTPSSSFQLRKDAIQGSFYLYGGKLHPPGVTKLVGNIGFTFGEIPATCRLLSLIGIQMPVKLPQMRRTLV